MYLNILKLINEYSYAWLCLLKMGVATPGSRKKLTMYSNTHTCVCVISESKIEIRKVSTEGS